MFWTNLQKTSFIRNPRFPYGIITIHLCYNKQPFPLFWQGTFAFFMARTTQKFKLAKMASK